MISDIVENISIKKILTTLEESFKLTMMFFRLTNSLVILQTIINKILQDLINTGKVMSFINNVIVGIEEEKGHDEIVNSEEVSRK